MKWVVVKIPENDGTISKSARFFDNAEEAVLYQQTSPYNTVLAYVENYKKPWWERLFEWINGKTDPTV